LAVAALARILTRLPSSRSTGGLIMTRSLGYFYKELMPNCHLVFVYDAGHAISTDRPEAFTEVVGDFIERREAFVIIRTETVIHP
jgi:hypothetical protein